MDQKECRLSFHVDKVSCMLFPDSGGEAILWKSDLLDIFFLGGGVEKKIGSF